MRDDRARRVAVVEQARRAGEALLAHQLLGDDVAVDAVQRVALAGDVADAAVVRHLRLPSTARSGVATIVPVASPKPIRGRSPPPHQPRSVTVSPSSRNVRVEPSASVSGSAPAPRQLDEAAPLAAVGPHTVPEPNRSPAPVDGAVDRQVGELLGERPVHLPRSCVAAMLLAVELDGEVEVEAPRPVGAQVRVGLRVLPGGSTRNGRRASSVTTHGEIVVAKLLPRCGPSGWYSKAWMSRADQSLSSTTPKTWRRRGRARSRVAGGPTDEEADLELDVERRVGAGSAARRRLATSPSGRTTACRRPRPCRPARGSRRGGAASSAAAARRRAAGCARGSWRGGSTSRSRRSRRRRRAAARRRRRPATAGRVARAR